MEKWPVWVQDLFWKWHNLRVWVRERLHPLTAEERERNMRDLLKGK